MTAGTLQWGHGVDWESIQGKRVCSKSKSYWRAIVHIRVNRYGVNVFIKEASISWSMTKPMRTCIMQIICWLGQLGFCKSEHPHRKPIQTMEIGPTIDWWYGQFDITVVNLYMDSSSVLILLHLVGQCPTELAICRTFLNVKHFQNIQGV